MSAWPYSTARWQRLRNYHLQMHPLCEACQAEGKVTAANHVDHRKPINAGGEAFPDHDGLASLCGPCHSRKTARGPEAGAFKSSKPRKGCRADGTPLDASHPWGAWKSPQAAAVGPPSNLQTQLVSRRHRHV